MTAAWKMILSLRLISRKKAKMNIIFLKVNIALFGYPSIFAVDYESIDMKQLIFIFTVAWGAVVGSRAQEVLTLDDCLRWGIENNLSLR